ncbi:MAG: GNAT family N-acetyltransferase [Bacteroidota bacterium]
MITGRRVVLREFRQEDLEAIQSWINNPHIRKFLGFSVFPQTLEESQDFLARQLRRQSDREISFAICLREDPEQRYIGGVGLHGIDYLHRRAEVGIALAREELFGKGLGAEAIELCCAFGFLRLGLHKISLRYFAYNKRGEACYRKIGFKEAGRLREHHFFNGEFHDEVLMDLLDREFLVRYPEAKRLFE